MRRVRGAIHDTTASPQRLTAFFHYVGMALRKAGLALALVGSAMHAQSACDSTVLQRLPLIERPATSNLNETLVVLLTGDGGWAAADEQVAVRLVERGAAVVGLNMRSYLRNKRSPEELATDLSCVASSYLERWHRARLMLLGYSRGADLAPFAVTRWSSAMREKLNMIALVNMAKRANFKFHLVDLIRDVERDDDIPTRPELSKLAGLRIVCVYGTEEADSGCLDLQLPFVQSIARPGGHRLRGGFDSLAEILAAGLAP